MPWPLTDREVAVEITGWVLPDEEAFVFTFNSINSKTRLSKTIPRDTKKT